MTTLGKKNVKKQNPKYAGTVRVGTSVSAKKKKTKNKTQ